MKKAPGLEAILFDLDDTLLRTNMARFMAAYFEGIAAHAAPLMDQKQFVRVLLQGTQAMMATPDATATNRQRFWDYFTANTGLPPAATEAHFDAYYREKFGALHRVTERMPGARALVDWSFAQGLDVVIATNPVFPGRAIEHRLAWADLAVDQYPYRLVTSYENMAATKPHEAYYREILARIDRTAAASLMVGNDWANDILPAAAVGLRTFWVDETGQDPPADGVVDGYGAVAALHARLQEGWLVR